MVGLDIQSKGISPSLRNACSHVSLISFVYVLLRLILEAVILSDVSLLLMFRVHRLSISSLLCVFLCITLLHLRTQMRCAASVSRICKRQHIALREGFFLAWFGASCLCWARFVLRGSILASSVGRRIGLGCVPSIRSVCM